MQKTFTTILLIAAVCAQMQAKKFHVDIDYHYSLGLYEKYAGESLTRGNYDMGGHALDLTFRYDVIKKLSVGAGIGLDRYTEPEYNTLPVYVTARYYPIEKVPHAYTYANLGYAIDAGDESTFYPGMTGGIGIGYTLMLSKKFGFNFQIGYNYKDFKDNYYVDYDKKNDDYYYRKITSHRHSVTFGLGITF